MLAKPLLFTLAVLAIPSMVFAQMQGGSYVIKVLDSNGGGGQSTGSVYGVQTTNGQTGSAGAATGGSYAADNGYQPVTLGADPVIAGSNPIAKTVAKNSTCPNTPNEVSVTAGDADSGTSTLTWRIKTAPTHGEVSFIGGTTGPSVTVCYEPDPGQTNSDSFVLQVYDGSGGSDDVTVNMSVSQAPVITAWYSVRTHGTAGTFALQLDAGKTGTGENAPTVEPRQTGVRKLWVTFSEAVVASDGGLDVGDVPVLVTADLEQWDPLTAVSVSLVGGSTLEVNFDGSGEHAIGDRVRANFDLTGKFKSAGTGLAIAGDADCQVRCLQGDVVGATGGGGNGQTDLIDMGAVKAKNREMVSADNFTYDLNVSGKIDLIDAAWCKALYGNMAP